MSRQLFTVTYDGDDVARGYLFKDNPATSTFPNQDTYVGPYLNRLKHGSATYTFTSVSPTTAYTGTYSAGQRDGQGTMAYPDGSTYAGQWKAGLREGWGRYTYKNGDVWVGEWKAGKKAGAGTYVYRRDGSSFDGQWTDGKCSEGTWSYHQQQQHRAEVKGNVVTRYL